MTFKVLQTTDEEVVLWDGYTRDVDRPGQPAGVMTIHLGPHSFREGQTVDLLVKLCQDAPQPQ